MKIFYKVITLLIILTSIFISCSKDEEREGCTDESALNFNSLAVVDDGSCQYSDVSFTIWSNGEAGFWGNATTGAFIVKNCRTATSTIFLNPDTTITPADTVIDNTTTPPDTSITPADTTITGDEYLLVNSDNQGNYELIIQLTNKQSAVDFVNGTLIFEAQLHPDAKINDFEVIIHGNHINSGSTNCSEFRQSDPVVISSAVLDTSSFKEVRVPLISFTNRHMNNIDLVFGIRGINAVPNNNLMLINNVRWEAK